MNRNLRLVLGISLIFGISTGVYEFVLPLFLKAHGLSFGAIGGIFALAGLAVVVVRIYMGGLADHWGRKPLYGLSLVVTGLAVAASPLLPAQMIWQALLKTLRETAALTRETIHPIILYEEGNEGFLNRIGKFRGFEFLLQAGGTMMAALIIKRLGANHGGYEMALYIAGALVMLSSFWWAAYFREHRRARPQRIISVRELVNFDLHANLRVILIASIIFTFGVQLSHSFYMVLFFSNRFHASEAVVGIIMVIHRITIALPMLVVGNLPIKNLRAWYVNGYLIQGITVAASALIPVPYLWVSAGIFLLHDLIGAGIWSPIQATLIQRYSRDETRGMEVGKVLAWSSIGAIFGPLAAGFLAGADLRLPFLISGILMMVAAIPLLRLNLRLPSPAEMPKVVEPVA